MEALVDGLREAHKVVHSGLGYDNVSRSKGFTLVQTPDVEFVNGQHAGNLRAR